MQQEKLQKNRYRYLNARIDERKLRNLSKSILDFLIIHMN